MTTGLGSTTAAAYGFNGDLNTGMYSPADHQVALLANGTNRLNVNSSGAQVTGSITASGLITADRFQMLNSSNEGVSISNDGSGTTTTVGHTAANNEGIFWHTTTTNYGIFRGAGTWASPDFRQLQIKWDTGIELDGGTVHGKSGVNVVNGNFKIGGTTVIDSSRNLTNIGTLNGGTPYTTANDTLLMHKGADIPGSANLNDYIAIGFYHQNSNANAASGSNYPVSRAGMLTVTADGVMVYQTYHEYDGTDYYIRSRYNGTWYGWRTLYHSGTGDLTVSGLVTADRYNSGLGTAASPAFQVGDTNTGFFDSGANTIGVACNGSHEFNFTAATLDMNNNTMTDCGGISLNANTNIAIGSSGGDAFNGDSAIRIGDTSNAYLQIITGTTAQSGILLGDTADDFVGGMIYLNSTNKLNLYANNAAQLVLSNGSAVFTAGAIDIPSQIRHSGDTDTYMQFHAANQFRVVTGGTERFEVNQGTATVAGTLNVRTAIDLADSDILRLGSGDDVEFFCNGSHMYMDLNSGIGNFYIRDGSTTRYTFNDNGSFTATGNITAYSDRRVKAQFEPITDALSKVQQLHGQTYIRTDMDDANRRYAGLIAQDVEAVLPEAVSELDDHLTLDYSGTIGLLVEAIKELKQEVNDLKAQLKDK